MSPGARSDAVLRRDLHRIRCFVRVIETGSINRAARHLGIAQSALSRCVRELELSFGKQLLQRSGRGSSPTEEGHRVFEAGLRMVEAMDFAESEYEQLRGNGPHASMRGPSFSDELLRNRSSDAGVSSASSASALQSQSSRMSSAAGKCAVPSLAARKLGEVESL